MTELNAMTKVDSIISDIIENHDNDDDFEFKYENPNSAFHFSYKGFPLPNFIVSSVWNNCDNKMSNFEIFMKNHYIPKVMNAIHNIDNTGSNELKEYKKILSNINDFNKIKNNIYLSITDSRDDFLKTLVHKDYLDFSLYAKISSSPAIDKKSVFAFKITNKMLDKWKKNNQIKESCSEEDIIKLGFTNEQRDNPYHIFSMESVVNNFANNNENNKCKNIIDSLNFKEENGIYIENNIRNVIRNTLASQKNSSSPFPLMLIITKKNTMYGSTAIVNKRVMHKLNDILQSEIDKIPNSEDYERDFYIIPSSVHECIIFYVPSTEGDTLNNVCNMIYEINRTQVDPGEVLTDSLYKFSNDEDCIIKI